MPKDKRMIGRRGEKQFDLLCSEANVTCNGSIEDDYGWDKHIEFPPKRLPFAAMDMQPGPIAASVQVKATEGTTRSISIRLSNALTYARSPIPQFIVLVVFGAAVPRYFVRHVWTPLIAEWLKAAREADSRGVTAPNRERVTVRSSAEDEHSHDLLAWILSEISAVRGPYAATKQAIADTVGFENGIGTAHVTLKLQGPHHLLDLKLGLGPPIRAERIVYHSERFGIQARSPELELQDAMLEIIPEGQSCVIRLEYPSGATVVTSGRCYGAEHDGIQAFRLSAGPIDIVYGPEPRVRAAAKLKSTDRLTLSELRAFAHFMASEAGAPIPVYVQLNGREMEAGSISMTGQADSSGWSGIALSTDVIRALVDEAVTNEPSLTINELNEEALALQTLQAVASERAIRIDYTPNEGEHLRVDGFLAYSSVSIGGQCYSAVARRPVVSDSMKRGRRKIHFGPAQVLWAQVVAKDRWSENTVRGAYQRHLDRLSTDGQLMAVGNLEGFVGRTPEERDICLDLPSGRDSPLSANDRNCLVSAYKPTVR